MSIALHAEIPLLTCNYRLTGKKYWYKSSGTTQSGRGQLLLLPERYRRLFANKQVVCIEYQDLPDSDEREIFQVSIELPPLVICGTNLRLRECNSGWHSLRQVCVTQ